jgi:flagellar protein FlaF
MSHASFARSAYGETDRSGLRPRAAEYRLFARITHRLADAARAAAGAAPDHFPRLAAAIADNLRLWNALAVDLARPGNALPEALRARLLSLAIFQVRHSAAVLEGRAAAGALVDINAAIMRGLRDGAGAGPAPAGAP